MSLCPVIALKASTLAALKSHQRHPPTTADNRVSKKIENWKRNPLEIVLIFGANQILQLLTPLPSSPRVGALRPVTHPLFYWHGE